jgi:hypothetical protein
VDETPCTQKQVCSRCGATGEINEKDHIWAWRFPEPDTFIQQEICTKCGKVGRIDDSGREKWSSIASQARKGQYVQLQQAIRNLSASQRFWKTDTTEMDWDPAGNPQKTIRRSAVSVVESTLDFTNIPVCGIKGDFGSLVFYPDRIAQVTNFPSDIPGETSSANYADCTVGISYTRFTETGDAIPEDAEIVEYTWLHTHFDGSPDESYADNQRIPIVKYAEVEIAYFNMIWVFQLSNLAYAAAFVECMSAYIAEENPHQKRHQERIHTPARDPSLGDKTPYQVLGIPQGASIEEITAAYRKLALENHPDRVSGMAEEFQILAEKRMKIINAAFDELKKSL